MWNPMRAIREWADQKASAVASIVVNGQAGQVAWTEARYDKMAKEGYQNCITAYRCMDEVAFNMASVDWILKFRTGENKWEPTDKHPVLDLIDRPNPEQSKSSFVYEWAAQIQLAGNAYQEGVGPDGGPLGGTFTELYNKRPDRMYVIKSEEGVGGYQFEMNGHQHKFEKSPDGSCNIRHWKLYHPLDDWYGMSPIEAASREIDIFNAFNTWNYNLLDNDARPSGIMSFDKTLGDKAFKRLRRQLRENHQGKEKTANVMILENNGVWTQYGFSPKDLDWITGKNVTARDIASSFKVPPVLLNIGGDTTFSNMKEARLWLWETTLSFYLNLLRDEWNAWLLPRYKDSRELYLDWDVESTPIAQLKKDMAWDRAVKGKGLLSINEIREMIGFEQVDDGDVILVSSGDVPLDMAGLGAGEGTGEDAAAKAMLSALSEEVRNLKESAKTNGEQKLLKDMAYRIKNLERSRED